MTKQYKEKAAKLGKIMNTKSKFSVPIVKVILECFEIVFSEEDIDRLLIMGEGEYSKEELRKLWNMELEEFQQYFTYLANRGVMWPRHEAGRYELSPIFPGWIEIYASGPEDENRKALLKKFSEFENILKMLNIPPVRAYMNHVNMGNMARESGRMSTVVARGKKSVTINQPITAEQSINIAGELQPMLKKHDGHIGIMNCFCRMMKSLDGGSCDFNMPIEGCIAVGRMADTLIENGVAKAISYEDVISLMDDLEKKGCIHTVYHYGINSQEEEIVICNCCMDCCFLYSSYREGALSQLLIKAYFKPNLIDENECIGCNKCGRYCPTSATYYDKANKKLIFDYAKCIGCGQCVSQCPKPVRQMIRDERNVFVKTKRKNKK